MILNSTWRRVSASLTGGAMLYAAVMATGLQAEPTVTVVMSGLDNPRGLAFGPEGALYVAEAGSDPKPRPA